MGFKKGNTWGSIHKGRDAFWMCGRVVSKSTREKIRKANQGKTLSDTTKEKLRLINIGKKHSDETIEKMKISQQKVMLEGRRKLPVIKMFGPENPQWKGGVTPINLQIRKSAEYKLWRASIFMRDNRMCIWCGFNKSIEVDHYPKMFSTIFHENKIKTLEEALVCEEFWNINNGRTLCHDCHRKTKTYGNRKKYV